MKMMLVIAAVAFMGLSCKKVVEETKKDYLLELMTNGTWYVESYLETETDVTPEFQGYSFQFFENGTVTGKKGNTGEQGTWAGDIPSRSIISEFPGVSDVLGKLNGTWKLKDSAADFVLAEMSTPSGKNVLKLRKKN